LLVEPAIKRLIVHESLPILWRGSTNVSGLSPNRCFKEGQGSGIVRN
jgi:hypothetical protein